MPVRDEYVSFAELGAEAGCSRWTINRWCRLNGVRVYQFHDSNRHYLHRADADRFKEGKQIERSAGVHRAADA